VQRSFVRSGRCGGFALSDKAQEGRISITTAFKSKPFLDKIKAAETETEARDARRMGATLLKVLDNREITVTRQVREDIAACTDLDRIDAAIVRAATADPKDPFAF
jgi:hypothetical protein